MATYARLGCEMCVCDATDARCSSRDVLYQWGGENGNAARGKKGGAVIDQYLQSKRVTDTIRSQSVMDVEVRNWVQTVQ